MKVFRQVIIDGLEQTVMRTHHVRLQRPSDGWLMALGACTAVILLFLFNRSFEPASFEVLSKSWSTTMQLGHDVEDSDGDDQFQVLDSTTLTGDGLDPIAYFTGYRPIGDQYLRSSLRTTIRLIHQESQKVINYHPAQDVYDQVPLGGYCHAEIGWFNYVRHMRCGGR